jgi:hypothetical protein
VNVKAHPTVFQVRTPDRFATIRTSARAVEAAVAGSVDLLIGTCGNPLFTAAKPANIEAAACFHRAVRTAWVPYLSVLHTPDEDLRFFRERVFPTLYVSIGDVTPLAGCCGFRDG